MLVNKCLYICLNSRTMSYGEPLRFVVRPDLDGVHPHVIWQLTLNPQFTFYAKLDMWSTYRELISDSASARHKASGVCTNDDTLGIIAITHAGWH